MNANKALKHMRQTRDDLLEFTTLLEGIDPDNELDETWTALDEFNEAISADIARLESGDIA